MAIREATITDAIELQQLVLSLSHYYLPSENALMPAVLSSSLTVSAFESRITGSEFDNFVYSDNGVIVGYLSIKNKTHVHHMFVAEEHHGKGIAKALWSFYLSENAGLSYTVHSSPYAVPVYLSFGFEPKGPMESIDGVEFQAMELVL